MLLWEELIQAKRDDILHAATKYGASNVRIFGSVARGEADDQSDLDLLVDMDAECSLLHLAGLLIELEELLGHRVDIVTEEGLQDRVRKHILQEAIGL